MRGMLLQQPRVPLRDTILPDPVPAANQVLVRVAACGVCRTDLHVVDGELTEPKLPIIPGHEIVGRIEGLGGAVTGFRVGERVGIPWLGHTCGQCRYCCMGAVNLCDAPGVWAGDSEQDPPVELDAAIIFAPVGSLVPSALANVRKGGIVVLGGIHMSDLPSMPYALLWGERVVRSVANLTRQDRPRTPCLCRTHHHPNAGRAIRAQ